MSGWMREVPDDSAGRRNFVPDDPTEAPDFDPSKWTGTVLDGLISCRTECGLCGAVWTDDHTCEEPCERCGRVETCMCGEPRHDI